MQQLNDNKNNHVADMWEYDEANRGTYRVYKVYDKDGLLNMKRIFGLEPRVIPFLEIKDMDAKGTGWVNEKDLSMYDVLVEICELPENRNDEELSVIMYEDLQDGEKFLEDGYVTQYYPLKGDAEDEAKEEAENSE